MTTSMTDYTRLTSAAETVQQRGPEAQVTIEEHPDHPDRGQVIRAQGRYSAVWGFAPVTWTDSHTLEILATEPRRPPDGEWHGVFARTDA